MNRLIISNDGNTQSGTVSSSKNIPFMSDEYAKKQNSEKRKSDITTKNNWLFQKLKHRKQMLKIHLFQKKIYKILIR